jgi:hypothetical protein
MRAVRGIFVIALAAVAGACSFKPGEIASDAATDGPPPITVGFASSTTTADEDSGTVRVRVVLSAPAGEAVTVSYTVTGGTATEGSDFTVGGTGSLTFAPGDVEETVDVTVDADGAEESDETIELGLQAVTGAGVVLANATHTLTIAANVLPRVTFAATASSDGEATSPAIDITLDKPSPLATSVDVTVMTGTATGGGVDYTFATQTVTFPPDTTTQQITLDVNNDMLDEDDEDVTLELTNAVDIIVGADSTHTHTITDNDAAPTVSFSAATSSVSEDVMTTDVVVSLSALSGKQVEVAFSVDGASTATETDDFTIGTTSPLTFMPGEQQMSIHVDIVQDNDVESDETVVLKLGTLTNATAGTFTTHTLTIVDDDTTCAGTGATQLCFPAPADPVTISGTLNTDTSTQCASTAPVSGWTGGPDSCFIVGTDVTIAATQVTGSRPLVVVASGDITVTGDLDAASHRGGQSGPGATTQTCTGYTRAPTASTNGAGGGAGATFRTRGGDGGDGNNTSDSGGAAPTADPAPTVLRAGCTGQNGASGTSPGNNGGTGGTGGGAVYLAAAGTLMIDSGVVIDVSGAGGTAKTSPGSGFDAGGGGGGSGGMLLLQAATYSVSGAVLVANGGGGSSGGDDDTAATSGSDPDPAAITTPAPGGPSTGNAGGVGDNGFAGSTQATNGQDQPTNNGGGGGGGGGGYVKANAALTGAQVSAGEIAAP